MIAHSRCAVRTVRTGGTGLVTGAAIALLLVNAASARSQDASADHTPLAGTGTSRAGT